VLDTNIVVAAGFARESASAAIVGAVARGELRMVWNDSTRREIEHILGRIPPLRGRSSVVRFREGDRIDLTTDPQRFRAVPDPDDRIFAALAHAAGAILVTNDDHLLANRQAIGVEVLTAGEFRDRYLVDPGHGH
jgi:predicted nucleic acid-binding protein